MISRTALFLCLLAIAFAGGWPQWRGPHRDGVGNTINEPKVWPEQLKLKWKVKVGEGHSTPLLAGGKIYIHARQEEREVVQCLRPEDGHVVWQESYAAPYTVNPAATSHGKGVKSTPVIEGGRIYTLGIGGILSCFDANTGKPQWRKEFGSPAFGVAMSPIVDHNMLIAHVGVKDKGALTAFDAQTGAEKWSWKGDGPAYASPIVVELGGTRQVVTQTQKNIVGIAAATGQSLWRIPFTTPYDQNIVTPVLYHDTLILSGLGNSTFAIKLIKSGAEWSTETLWQNKDAAMYMNSPVLSGDLLFGMAARNKGQFFCLDPRNGTTLWTSPPRQADNAAIVDAGPVLLILTTDSELMVVRKSAKAFEVVRKYTVADSPTWAHPVVFGNGILIKDSTMLSLWNIS